MNAEASAVVGKELASLLRSQHAGQRVSEKDVTHALGRMLIGEATTAADALALLVAARALMAIPLSMVPPIEESQDGLAVHCLNELIHKAIGALEVASGQSQAAFTGQAPAIN